MEVMSHRLMLLDQLVYKIEWKYPKLIMYAWWTCQHQKLYMLGMQKHIAIYTCKHITTEMRALILTTLTLQSERATTVVIA